jgi:hypothetical protein
MAGASDYFSVPAPSPQQWMGPQVDFMKSCRVPQECG